MPSTVCNSVVMVFDSSTVITPSLPTFFIASAMTSPMVESLFAQRAYEAGRPCPISISIGTHPVEIMGSGFRAPLGVDEMAIAGGLRGEPVALAPCETIHQ